MTFLAFWVRSFFQLPTLDPLDQVGKKSPFGIGAIVLFAGFLPGQSELLERRRYACGPEVAQ